MGTPFNRWGQRPRPPSSTMSTMSTRSNPRQPPIAHAVARRPARTFDIVDVVDIVDQLRRQQPIRAPRVFPRSFFLPFFRARTFSTALSPSG
jgi:hypothetical protein